MSRFPSLRSFWTTLSSAALVASVVALGCASVFAQGSGDPGAPGGSMSGYDDSYYYGSSGGYGGQQRDVLTNLGSGIKRPDNFSSVGAVQALLYGDTALVVHFNLAKIDYESTKAFIDELVDKAAGSIQSDDTYLVQLREYQKEDLKESVQEYLSTLQRAVVEHWYNNGMDEAYVITYQSTDPAVLGSTIMAFPTEGLSEAQVQRLVDVVDRYSPYAVFVRYGFVIAVIRHDDAPAFDLAAFQARFAPKLQSGQNQSYGSYSSGSPRSSGFGSSGYGPNVGGSSSTNLGSNAASLQREYSAELASAREAHKRDARRLVLPRIRNRFELPASAEESADFMRGLSLSDGAVLTFATTDLQGLGGLILKEAASAGEAGTPFGALGQLSGSAPGATPAAPKLSLGSMDELLGNETASLDDLSCLTFSISLVGDAPRGVLFLSFNNEDDAKSSAKVIETTLTLTGPMILEGLKNQMANAGIDTNEVDLSPIFSGILAGLKPRVSGSDLALVLDLEPLKANAGLFVPLLGGVETKSRQEMESDMIDWSIGSAPGGASTTAPADDSAAADPDDPFGSLDLFNTDDASDDDSSTVDPDDPFGSSDPFGADDDSTGAPADDPFGTDDPFDPFGSGNDSTDDEEDEDPFA
ncbi:MAG: hypothetical protein ACOX0A_04875 [Thermoguttaceae bacterium]|jgi:hypothetical protein